VLTLTADGEGLYGEIAPLALAYEAALVAGLAPGEVTLMKRLLSRLQAAATGLAGEAAADRANPSPEGEVARSAGGG
jgi:hypothetical protein